MTSKLINISSGRIVHNDKLEYFLAIKDDCGMPFVIPLIEVENSDEYYDVSPVDNVSNSKDRL